MQTGFRAYDHGAVPEHVDDPCDERALRKGYVGRQCITSVLYRRASSRSAASRSRLLLDVDAHREFLFMNKFRKLGLIEYNGELKVHSSLLNVIVRE